MQTSHLPQTKQWHCTGSKERLDAFCFHKYPIWLMFEGFKLFQSGHIFWTFSCVHHVMVLRNFIITWVLHYNLWGRYHMCSQCGYSKCISTDEMQPTLMYMFTPKMQKIMCCLGLKGEKWSHILEYMNYSDVFVYKYIPIVDNAMHSVHYWCWFRSGHSLFDRLFSQKRCALPIFPIEYKWHTMYIL